MSAAGPSPYTGSSYSPAGITSTANVYFLPAPSPSPNTTTTNYVGAPSSTSKTYVKIITPESKAKLLSGLTDANGNAVFPYGRMPNPNYKP